MTGSPDFATSFLTPGGREKKRFYIKDRAVSKLLSADCCLAN
jgi:hypothetical protein